MRRGEPGSWERSNCEHYDSVQEDRKRYNPLYVDFSAEEKKIEVENNIEAKKLEKIEMKKRYIRENFLGDYPKEIIEKKFIYNDKITMAWSEFIPTLFIDFSVGGRK